MYLRNKQRSYIEKISLDKYLKGILSNLRNISDVQGAILIDGKNSILAYDMQNGMNPLEYLHGITRILDEERRLTIKKKTKRLFIQHIFDYNGCKVLAKKIKELTLLVMLEKRGYISLAMLDIENSVREIENILKSNPIRSHQKSMLNLTSIFLISYPMTIKSLFSSYGERDEYR